jgi:bleomycin hydrolase
VVALPFRSILRLNTRGLIASLFLAIIAANNFLNMKYGRLAVLTAVLFTAQSAVAQVNGSAGPYTFEITKENATGTIENQCQTGTCWSFATMSFLEAEVLRKGGKAIDLSEMYNVRVNYPLKAEAFVRYQGKQQFGPGGLSHDVLTVLASHGMVPETAYSGLKGSSTEHNHGSLDALLESTVKTVLDKKLNEEGAAWKNSIEGILDAELGPLPATFEYNGKKYTPMQFRDEMKINPSEYVSISSFTHHPFYAPFVLEVPDNWAKGSFYNVPMQDLERITDYAIDNGYTVAWDADVSEKGFSYSQGVAILPAVMPKKDEWFTSMHAELVPTAELRQEAFDRFETTDDHLMHITGKSKDQKGNIYYITKNSWGATNPFKGYLHVSKNYYLMKTVGIVVHRDAIPADIQKKLGLK